MNFNKYSKTPQFDAAIKSIRMSCDYHNEPYPVIQFTGTVKLHGTNAGVGFKQGVEYGSTTQEVWFQSRERAITPEDDNAGFASWGTENAKYFRSMMANVARMCETDEVMIFGEWAGGNIQGSDVAIRHLPKTFYVFAIKYKIGEKFEKDAEGVDQLVPVWASLDIKNITFSGITGMRNINEFQNTTTEVDVNNPSASIEFLHNITRYVEDRCPVAYAQGVEGIGEGLVWEGKFKGETFVFKTKGEKHSTSKVTTLRVPTAEDLARIAAAGNFVDAVATENRLNQGFDKLQELGLTVEMKNLGTYLKWVNTDINEEDGEMIEVSMVDRKALGAAITQKAKAWFIAKMKEV